MLKNVKFINDLGGISATNEVAGVEVYLRPGDLVHDLALAGTFGPVAPYAPPPPPEAEPTYPNARGATAALVEWLGAFFAPLISYAPFEEQLSWATKEVAARDYLAGTASTENAALIEGEAAIVGETPADLAQVILDNAAIFRAASIKIAGLRRKTTATLYATSDPFEFDTVIAAAQADAQSWAADNGLGFLVPSEAAE